MERILIKDGYLITMDAKRRVFERGSILVEGDKIVSVGEEVRGSAEEVIDARGKVVMPGLINAHTHLSMTLLRGLADDMALMPWLETKIWPIEKHLRNEDVYAGALLGCLEMIKSGTTCFADQYFFMESVARAVTESGIRGVLAHGMIEAGKPDKGEAEIVASESFVKACHGMAEGRVRAMFGPHAAYTCSPEFLIRVKELAAKYRIGIHIHVSETKDEVELIQKKYGRRPVEHLDAIGFLGPEVLAAHCVWLNDGEIATLKMRGVKPVHCPVSNMKIACGVSPVPEMLHAGIWVALGTDGAASNNSLDMFKEMKFAALLNKVHRLNAEVMPAQSVLEMATVNGAAALGLSSEVGSLEAGKKADIVIVDMEKPHLVPRHNVISHLVYSAVGSDVDTVIVDGKIIMSGRKVLSLDEQEVLNMAMEASRDLSERSGVKG